MLTIERATLDSLGFDFKQALADYTQAKLQHAKTVDVPAPTAHYLVEAAYLAGEYQVVSSTVSVSPSFKTSALAKLKAMKGKKVETQLEEIQEILLHLFEE